MLVAELGEIVHPGDDRHGAAPVLVLAFLFHPGVQVADDRLATFDLLAVELEEKSKDSVRGRVNRSHVDDHAVVFGLVGLDVCAVPPLLNPVNDVLRLTHLFAPGWVGPRSRRGGPAWPSSSTSVLARTESGACPGASICKKGCGTNSTTTLPTP